MSVKDINVFNFADITTALQSAVAGDVFNFFIKNDIVFSSAVMISNNISVNLINDSGNVSVTLSVTSGGAFRHFATGTGGNLTGLSLTVGTGIILDGGGTGGGIQIFGSGCTLTLDGCTVNNCLNSGNGGGVLIQGNISRSRLILNGVLIENCQAGSGGGVFGGAVDIEMNGGEISGNRAITGGGGITTIAGANRLGSTITINNGRISNNSILAAFGNGGGIQAFDTIVTIQSGEVSDNTADDFGGGIFSLVQSLTGNENKLIIKDSAIRENTIRNFGGGIGVSGALGEFTILNTLITENEAVSVQTGSNQGGGIYFAGGSTLMLIDGQVTRNRAGRSGGGIFANASELIITGTAEISENQSDIIGGGIYGFFESTVTIGGNARVINNKAKSNGDAENTQGGGGAIALYATELTIKDNAVISGNSALSYGGAIWTFPDFTPVSSVFIEGGTIEDNLANYGGAISMGAIAGLTPALTITGGTINNNTAFKDGGGIIARGSAVSVANSEITYNSAGRNGGGIFTDELANVTVFESAIFNGNIAQTYVYWTVTSGGDSDIHKTHIFTEHFSTFIPTQTPPVIIWNFLNAYNNYDINYMQPLKTVTVSFFDTNNPARVIHSTILDSFPRATVTIPARNEILDSDNNVWFLQPPNQPDQTIELNNPEADYVVTVSFEIRMTPVAYVVVTELYVDICGCQIMKPTQTIVMHGGNYSKTAPKIKNYIFVGYRVNCGPLQTGTVNIVGIMGDTIITFVYRKKCLSSLSCCRKVPVILSPAPFSTVSPGFTIEGVAKPDSKLVICIDNTVFATIEAFSDGFWSVIVSKPLDFGKHTVCVFEESRCMHHSCLNKCIKEKCLSCVAFFVEFNTPNVT